MDDDFLTDGHFTVFSQVSGRFFSSKEILISEKNISEKKFPCSYLIFFDMLNKSLSGIWWLFLLLRKLREWGLIPAPPSHFCWQREVILHPSVCDPSDWDIRMGSWHLDWLWIQSGKRKEPFGVASTLSWPLLQNVEAEKRNPYIFFFLVTRRNAEDFFFWSLATMSRHICPSVVAFTQQFFKFLLDLWRHQ